jgi:hypothetical protein
MAKPKAAAKRKAAEDGLILVEKDGEQIRVHPLSLENHKQLGWKVVEEPAVSVETAEGEPESDDESGEGEPEDA